MGVVVVFCFVLFYLFGGRGDKKPLFTRLELAGWKCNYFVVLID